MLTPGSRIGPAIILRHIREGLFGDAYKVEVEAGRGKGENFLVKVLPRELVEGIGFSDNFLRECQVIEQLDQDGHEPQRRFLRLQRELPRAGQRVHPVRCRAAPLRGRRRARRLSC
mgnify:CR=1 FL=1